jgi:hypothetical protein
VFKDFQREMERFHQTGLKIMKNGWQNLIGIIFIFPGIFWIFLRERVTALLESAVKKTYWIINY